MSTFPTTAEKFYARRDDRTNRCASDLYQTVSCAVCISEQSASTRVGQTMVIAVCELLSRWCRRIRIQLPATRLLPSFGAKSDDLGAYLLERMRAADPFGDFELLERDRAEGDVAISIGGFQDARATPSVYIDASGWLASLSGRQPIALPIPEDGNVLGGLAAACLGVAQAFKMAVRQPDSRLIREGVFDLFRLTWSTDFSAMPWPTQLDIGRILMVGAGSVGSSAAFCMRWCGLAGGLTVLDADIVKIENFNRSPVFDRQTLGLNKADAVAHVLKGSLMSVTPVPQWWDDFVKQRGRIPSEFDIWLPLANEFNVRWSMQNNVPPLMVHASTTMDWGVNHGRHLPGRDDCLADRFPKVAAAADMACSTGVVATAGPEVHAALPFASMFAGVLIAADLVRTQVAGYPQVPNFALFDFSHTLESIHLWNRLPAEACVCRDQGRAFQDLYNGGTRYRALFAV